MPCCAMTLHGASGVKQTTFSISGFDKYAKTTRRAAFLSESSRALANYRDALRLARELELRPLEAQCHFALGELARKAGEAGEAERRFRRALSMFRQMGMQS